ncbi:PrgI family protein [Candidatus Parcubacteria bacterium]|nr:MAG: PrgI family protein [Candidatus Parcubacteria bacterium]
MQFQVPQFIETEDKIVGPLTLRQFIYVAIAGGASAFFYFTLKPWLWVGLSIVLFGLALSFAFIKINGRGFPEILVAALRFYWEPQTYAWRPESKAAPAEPKRGFSVESIISGLALKTAWRNLQTGTAQKPTRPLKERYEIFRKMSGERRAARRIDYR